MTHNFYYPSPSFLLWCGQPHPFSSLHPCGRTSHPLGDQVVAGFQLGEEGEKACIPWSIGGVFSSSLEVHLSWSNLTRRRRRCFGGFSSRKTVAPTTSEVRRGIRQKTQRFLLAKEKVYQYLISASYQFYSFVKIPNTRGMRFQYFELVFDVVFFYFYFPCDLIVLFG